MKRSRMIVLGLTAVFVLVAVGFVLVQQLSVTATATPGMQLTVSDPPGVCASEKCTLDTGASFTLSVEIVKAPVAGYITSQSYVDYGTDLTYTKKAAIADEVQHPDCGLILLGGQFPQGNFLPGQRSHSCSSGDFPDAATSTYVGPFIELQMTCSASPSSTLVELLPIGHPIAAGSGAGFIEPDSATQHPTSDTLTINCNETTATPTPTSTATATSTRTATAAATQPSTATSTPKPTVPPGKAKMSFRVYADKGKNQLVCAKGPIHRKCDVLGGVGFSIDVVADVPPAGGYTAYQIALQFSPNITLQQQPGVSEHLFGNCNLGSETKGPGSYTLTCKLDDRTTFSGALANIQFNCSGGSGQIDLIGGAGAGVSVYVSPSIFGSLVFLKSADKGGKLVADSVSITCLDDFDGDGCTNAQELGPDPTLGGQRDPKNPWDFFDVNGDKNIDFPNDLLPVILAYQQGPLDAGGPGPNYTTAKDRGPAKAGAQFAWQRTGPDGHIDVPNDFLPIILQYLHTCK